MQSLMVLARHCQLAGARKRGRDEWATSPENPSNNQQAPSQATESTLEEEEPRLPREHCADALAGGAKEIQCHNRQPTIIAQHLRWEAARSATLTPDRVTVHLVAGNSCFEASSQVSGQAIMHPSVEAAKHQSEQRFERSLSLKQAKAPMRASK